ncbi:MAG TPA: FAD-dependent monooxygenase [Nocardioidaceae bacterium]|jgi:2-polyprenyl-6-methoxyphenol hydroxylase-like FAD-dependent oxidoreductase
MTACDVVVVGGGIGGAALAYGLAQSGLGVVVLEASKEFPDRVRGESMQLWGLAEARRLGVEDVLLKAGAHIAPVWRQYVEGIGEPGDIPASMLLPDIPGTLNLRHPDACQALLDAAAGAGATVVRGVADVTLTAGPEPAVSYRSDGDAATVKTTLVVGADGRASTIRRQAGIELHRQEPINYIAGLLVDGLDGVPDDYDVLVSEGDYFSLMFHQGGGRARLYLCGGRSMQHRFAGQDGVAKFMAAWNPSCYPETERVARATPAGPCATYPGDDTWTDAPAAPGVVLIGDAAGHNDPIIGQGLSIAMRDARMVRDLVVDGARQPADFAPYATERVDRMRRLRLAADIMSVVQAEDCDNLMARRQLMAEKMAAMDPEFFPVLIGCFTGPETIPEECVDDRVLDRLRRA